MRLLLSGHGRRNIDANSNAHFLLSEGRTSRMSNEADKRDKLKCHSMIADNPPHDAVAFRVQGAALFSPLHRVQYSDVHAMLPNANDKLARPQ